MFEPSSSYRPATSKDHRIRQYRSGRRLRAAIIRLPVGAINFAGVMTNFFKANNRNNAYASLPESIRSGESAASELGHARAQQDFIRQPRVLIRQQPGFYVMRLRRGSPLTPALIYQLCPMTFPEPAVATGPSPHEWCRPRDRSPVYRATLDGEPVPVDLLWTARSLRPIREAEYRFRTGTLRQWARSSGMMPEAAPQRQIDLTTLPSLY